jgi:iron complex outermembrane receptor protein
MQKKLSPAKKKLLYALVGSSLFWTTPLLIYANDTTQTATPSSEAESEQTAAGEKAAGQREFTLDEVKVTADRDHRFPAVYAGGLVARSVNLGVLGDRDFLDTPFSITSYTAKTMENQQASTLYDVLINDPAVRFTTSGGHMQENFSIRGFTLTAEELRFNGLQGLVPVSHVPVEFLERVEVFKGPSSFLNGGVNGAVGGMVNLVPKRAGEEDTTTLTTDYASSAQFGGHIDIGRRYGADKEFGIRFNGVYKEGGTATDGQSKERFLGALGLDYHHDKWRLSLDAYGSQENYDNGSTVMYQLLNSQIKAPDGSTNLVRGTYGSARNNAVLFKGEYDIADKLTAYAGIGRLTSNTSGFITGNHARNVKSDGSAEFYQNNQRWWTDSVSSEFGLRGNYLTGSVSHQIVVGANRIHSESGNALNSVTTAIPINIYQPAALNLTASTPPKPAKNGEKEFSSVFIADTMSWNEEKVQLTLGVRHQQVNTQGFNASNGAVTAAGDASANTPLIGLVVKPWGNSLALYANYMEALSAGDTVATGALIVNSGEVLPPYKSKQQEVGLKWDRGNFANTLSLYQITKPNKINVYLPPPNAAKYSVTYDGEQENRGIEWSTFGKVAENVRILGGITYMNGELVRTQKGETDGNTPYGIPKWLMNVGVEWDTPWDRNLTLSLRAIYTGSQYLDSKNTSKIPDWIRYDLGASYKATINKTPVVFRASVENVFDKNYWAGSFGDGYATLGSPRTYKLSATMQL